MALTWNRLIASVAAPLVLAACALLTFDAHAAKKADPCKVNAKSSACKAQQKKASAQHSGKTASSKKAVASKTATAKATASKNARSRTGAKSSGKATTTKAIKKKVAAKTSGAHKRGYIARTRKQARSHAALPAVAESAQAEARALRSSTVYVQDLETSEVLFAKNEDVVRPIASISKLMTALVVVDANLPMDEVLEITEDDMDDLKHTTSRLAVGTRLTRADMLHLALMSSENRAAHALGRNYPGGMPAFVAAMNEKARGLGMMNTHFIEPTGLSSENVSSPRDLARLLRAAAQRPLIHRYSTDSEHEVEVRSRTQVFRNTNLLVRKPDWDIKVSKTGFINEAGECLVMLARISGRDVAIVLLDSQGKLSRIGDAVRLRRIVQSEVAML